MTPFSTLTAVACPLDIANVDTDQILPARFLKRAKGSGLGAVLFADLRCRDGVEIADFPLNRAPWRGAEILVAGNNFGSGSSREAAVYALAEYGFRCVLAPGFGDIFAQNAVKNGFLPGVVTDATAAELMAALAAQPATPVTVDLAAGTVAWGNRIAPFAIDAVWREQLLHGWDDLDVTRSFQAAIDAFKTKDAAARPWMRPATARQT